MNVFSLACCELDVEPVSLWPGHFSQRSSSFLWLGLAGQHCCWLSFLPGLKPH